MRIVNSSFAFALLVATLACAAKERISILDFSVSATAKKAVNQDASQDLTQQVRDAATNMIDPAKFEVMTRENILVMLPPGKKDLSECEGQCEVETARNLGSRWHVVGDVKKVGSALVLSIRLYDVLAGTSMSGERIEGAHVDVLVRKVAASAQRLLGKIPGLKSRIKNEEGMVGLPEGTMQVSMLRGITYQEKGDPQNPRTGLKRNFEGSRKMKFGNLQMDQNEVTQRSYQSVMHETPWKQMNALWGGEFPVGPNLPAYGVSQQDAARYCKSLGKRLPTQSEFQYALQAGSTDRDAFELDSLGQNPQAHFPPKGLANNLQFEPRKVGGLKPNPWGLNDLAGNVAEWTSDSCSIEYNSQLESKGKGFSQNQSFVRYTKGFVLMGGSALVVPEESSECIENMGRLDSGFRCVLEVGHEE